MMVKCCLLLCYYAFGYACIGEPMMVKFCLFDYACIGEPVMVNVCLLLISCYFSFDYACRAGEAKLYRNLSHCLR